MLFSVLSCGVFEEEVTKELARRKALSLDSSPLEVKFFDIYLHNTPDILRNKVMDALDSFSDKNEYILLLFGLCGNGACGIKSDKFKLVIPRVHECIGIFAGGAQQYAALRKSATSYFCSPGWAKDRLLPGKEYFDKIRKEYEEKFDEDNVDFLMEMAEGQYRAYDTLKYVGFYDRPDTEEYCKDCARYMKWKFEKIKGDPIFFEDALAGKWDKNRFLFVPKGKTIKASFGEDVLTCE